jgi:DNA (cytosine-5)-methyltransferase 3A
LGIKVLSLFDGMSCGQIALDQLGIKVDTYYASEIDKYGIEITQKNYPNTVQVGDITKLDPKDFADVDLIMGGSPCQGFSFAGKQLAFDDPRSVLFFEFIRLLKAIKPKYFLLENVRMKKEFIEVITQQVSECYPDYTNGLDLFGGRIEPILINSSLVSAQSRQRLYWTNIPGIEQPEERGIVLRDILETEPETFTAMSDKFVKRNGDRDCMIDLNKEKASNLSAMEYVKNGRQGDYLACDGSGKPMSTTQKKIEKNKRNLNEKAAPLLASTYKGIGNNGTTLVPTKPKQVGIAADIKGHDILKRVYSPEGKPPTLTTMGGGHREPKVALDKLPDKANVIKSNYYKSSKANFENDTSKGGKFSATGVPLESKIRNKSKTVRSGGRLSYDKHEWDSVDELHWRKLTPLECERLQTVPDNYTEGVSNTQRYKMLGNGWTVEVIKHIFKNIEQDS